MTRRLTPFVVLALAVAAGPLAAQPRAPGFDSYRATIDTNLRLYTDPVIQADLKLTDEQKAKLARIPDDLLAKHKDAIDKEKAASKEAADKRAALQAELEKKIGSLIEKNLTTDQRKRLGQMATQAMGISAFREAEVAKTLSLPADYQIKLSEIQQAGFEKLQKEFPNGGGFDPRPGDAEERRKYTEASRKVAQETIAKFVETFTDEQKKAWKDLVGEPWDDGPVGTVRGPGGRLLFNPGMRFFWLTPLLTNEKALAELKVENAAREALAEGSKAIRDASQAGTGQGFGGSGGFSNSVSRTLAQETASVAGKVLTESQTKRLEQIRFQMSGTGVFSATPFTMTAFTPTGGTSTSFRALSANPLAKLTLTPAQVVKIDAVLADAAKKLEEIGRGRGFVVFEGGFGGLVPPDAGQTEAQKARAEEARKAAAEYQQKVIEIEQKALADVQTTFDVGQKAAWLELTGEPIELSKLTADARFRRGTPIGLGGPGGGRGGRNLSIVTLWIREATGRGEYAAALATYDEAIRLAPTNTAFLQQKASLLASCPSEWVRDGKQAVELMKKVMAEAKEPTAGHHLVLAAALAETGQFDEAVKTQEKAIAMLPKENPDGDVRVNVGLRESYEARPKLYQEKKPFRQELRTAKTPTPTTGTER